jgi:uncharacterized membrane protein YfcA
MKLTMCNDDVKGSVEGFVSSMSGAVGLTGVVAVPLHRSVCLLPLSLPPVTSSLSAFIVSYYGLLVKPYASRYL